MSKLLQWVKGNSTIIVNAGSATSDRDISSLDTLSTVATGKTWPEGDRGGQFRPWPRHAGPISVGAASTIPAHPASSHDVGDGR